MKQEPKKAESVVLRFIWRDMRREQELSVCKLQVLPFRTTCKPCCAIDVLQCHIQDNRGDLAILKDMVHQSFYVDNSLQSTCVVKDEKDLDGQRKLHTGGGFEIRQWASNFPPVIEKQAATGG